jgi:hypothetical protein
MGKQVIELFNQTVSAAGSQSFPIDASLWRQCNVQVTTSSGLGVSVTCDSGEWVISDGASGVRDLGDNVSLAPTGANPEVTATLGTSQPSYTLVLNWLATSGTVTLVITGED